MSDRKLSKKAETPPPPGLVNGAAERAIIGMLIADNRRWFDIADRLLPDHFAEEVNRRIYIASCELMKDGKAIRTPLILSVVGAKDDDKIELHTYLAALIAEAPSEDIQAYVDAVLEAAWRRKGIEEAKWLADEMHNAARSRMVEEIVSEAHRRLDSIRSTEAEEAKSLGELSWSVLNKTTEIRTNGRAAGLKSGLPFIDTLIGSMLPGQLIVIAGFAGAGKSALSVQMGLLIAQQGIPTHCFSLEMEGEELASRMLGTFAEVPANKIAEAELTDEEMVRLADVDRQLRSVPFFIDAKPKPTTATLHSRAARAKAKHNIGLFITDHLRMVRADNGRAEERERLEQIVQDHKSMAKSLGVPWILLAHLSRMDLSTIKTGKDIRRPNMRDLYGSSAIENTADVVLFVHRPWVILQDVRPAKNAKHFPDWEADVAMAEGKAEIVLGKRRGGKGRGIKTCRFDDRLTWFKTVEN